MVVENESDLPGGEVGERTRRGGGALGHYEDEGGTSSHRAGACHGAAGGGNPAEAATSEMSVSRQEMSYGATNSGNGPDGALACRVDCRAVVRPTWRDKTLIEHRGIRRALAGVAIATMMGIPLAGAAFAQSPSQSPEPSPSQSPNPSQNPGGATTTSTSIRSITATTSGGSNLARTGSDPALLALVGGGRSA